MPQPGARECFARGAGTHDARGCPRAVLRLSAAPFHRGAMRQHPSGSSLAAETAGQTVPRHFSSCCVTSPRTGMPITNHPDADNGDG